MSEHQDSKQQGQREASLAVAPREATKRSPDKGDAHTGKRPETLDHAARVSPDPLHATDRYRLATPYSLRF